ncbi:MAG TPA: OsmC family protein [Chloroflexia bacterium]|nr:OsmC family protein [Chloroflexia bacterium]
MYGTLAGALSGRQIKFDRQNYSATIEGRIAGYGKTIRIESILVHYDLSLPADTSRETVERVLRIHPQGCPAHQSVRAAIKIDWDATVHFGEETLFFKSEAADTEEVV